MFSFLNAHNQKQIFVFCFLFLVSVSLLYFALFVVNFIFPTILSQDLLQSPIGDNVADAFHKPDILRVAARQGAAQQHWRQVEVRGASTRGQYTEFGAKPADDDGIDIQFL